MNRPGTILSSWQAPPWLYQKPRQVLTCGWCSTAVRCKLPCGIQDETRLLARLEALLQRFPLERDTGQPAPWGWCATHKVQMRERDGRFFHANGQDEQTGKTRWCRGD